MLLFSSHTRSAQYYVGDYKRTKHSFIPDYHGRMNYGPKFVGSLHAPAATIDDKGRFLAFFNVKEGKPREGWNDIMAVPRRLSLDAENSLRIEPVAELETLRFDHRRMEMTEIPANGEVVLDSINGKAMELEVVIDPGESREVGLYVFRSPDSTEQTRVSLFRKDIDQNISSLQNAISSLQIDVAASSMRGDVLARITETGPLKLAKGEMLHLRIFIDRSIVEVFANGTQCLTVRAYPKRDDSNGVSLFARGRKAKLISLDA